MLLIIRNPHTPAQLGAFYSRVLAFGKGPQMSSRFRIKSTALIAVGDELAYSIVFDDVATAADRNNLRKAAEESEEISRVVVPGPPQ
jgi:hypothetical protein